MTSNGTPDPWWSTENAKPWRAWTIPFLVMQFVDGVTLRSVLGNELMPPERALRRMIAASVTAT